MYSAWATPPYMTLPLAAAHLSGATFVLATLAQSSLANWKVIYGGVGFPIRTFADQSSFASSPQLFAGYRVLLRL
jgi:hypothetical protein